MYLVGLPTAKYVCTEYTYLVPSRDCLIEFEFNDQVVQIT